MSRDKPVARAVKLLTLIENNGSGLRVADMAEQLGANTRAVCRDLQVLEALRVPIYPDKDGRESYWKIDADYRTKLSVPFTLSELLSLYLAQDSIRPLDGTVLCDYFQSLLEKVWEVLTKTIFKQKVALRNKFFSGYPTQKYYIDISEW